MAETATQDPPKTDESEPLALENEVEGTDTEPVEDDAEQFTPAELHQAALQKAERLLSDIAVEVADLKDEVKKRSKALEAAVDDYRMLKRRTDHPMPLFDQQHKDAAWRDVLLSEFFTGVPLEACQKKGLETWGQYNDWLKKYRPSDLKGIGAEKDGEMCDAVTDYLEAHPEYADAKAEPEPTETTD